MNLLVDDLDKFIEFLTEHEITADQFLFCCLMSSEYDEEGSQNYNLPDRQEAISSVYKYRELVAKKKENLVWAKEDLEDLVDKNLLKDVNTYPDKFTWDNFRTTRKFIDLVFEEKDDLKEQYLEFWDEYPARYEGDDGTMFNIKAVNKEEMFHVYKKALNDVEHETLMDCLKLAKQKDEVNCRLDKWLKSHQWEPYLDEIEKGVNAESVSQTVL